MGWFCWHIKQIQFYFRTYFLFSQQQKTPPEWQAALIIIP